MNGKDLQHALRELSNPEPPDPGHLLAAYDRSRKSEGRGPQLFVASLAVLSTLALLVPPSRAAQELNHAIGEGAGKLALALLEGMRETL